jgi:hypothetical protein
MILTKISLRSLLENMWISIPESFEKELLVDYGHPVMDDEGHMREYTEQDIYEQVRKRLIHEGYFR